MVLLDFAELHLKCTKWMKMKRNLGRPQILLVQRSCVERYPPVLHQADLLSVLGDVTLLDAATTGELDRVETPSKVKRVRVTQHTRSSSKWGRAGQFVSLAHFCLQFLRQVRSKPDVLIAYDAEAISLMLILRGLLRHTMCVAHLHELPDAESYAGSSVSMAALRYLLKHLKSADLVVAPDLDRADYTQRAAGLKERPLVVMNCSRLLRDLPESRLAAVLCNLGVQPKGIVYYQGALAAEHGLEAVVRSMPYWPEQSVLVLVGSGTDSYRRALLDLAGTQEVERRVIWLGRIPLYSELFSYAVGASVGLALLDTSLKQWEYSAGASNKRFEYAALGVPVVTSDGPGIQELFVEPGLAVTASYSDPRDIGEKIRMYLQDDGLRHRASAAARALHLSSYNYEYQIQPLVKAIQRWISGSGAGS